MKDYIDQLKKYWKSEDLTFIATLKKNTDNKFGFFIDFINPISKLKLLYPIFDDIQIEDKRVSMYYKHVEGLVDGDFFKVELEYNSNSQAKNNPYLLQIKSVEKLDQEKVKQVLHFEGNDTAYVGQYQKISDKFCCFKNVMASDSGDILMNNGEAQQVFVSPNLNLKENQYYSFQIQVNEGKLPNAIPNTIKELKINPYQDYIRLRFERLNNPEANKMIANLMREIGKGMYSSKQRMIFELLQNADDAPGKEKVEFHIDINGDYFFVMHDGAPFNKDDVEAITSAAESTKINQNKKTGYKGIGFKSVFTDSTEVWIKTGGYQFAFIRNSELFENFDRFYFSSERYKKYPELIEEDQTKYRNQRLRFNGATDIPWQVIPIWQDDLPQEFKLSNFNNFDNPVQFALRLGESNIEDYKTAIENITKRPQFILFLRNTSKFRSPKNGVTVLRKDVNNVIEITKTKRDERPLTYTYLKQTYENIEVSEEAFASQGIGLKKQSRINDYNEVSYYFTDLDGKEIETIPPKLASVDETEISFGISIIDGKINAERNYLKSSPHYSSLFTYLPMEDTRFQFPFLVNADFVPSSDRQKIQGDNLWNRYIMIKIAEKHIDVLNLLAIKYITETNKYSNYLSLLLKNLIPDDDTSQQIINCYNNKYLEKLKITPILVNVLEEVQLLSETIIDDTGFTELFGHELFYEIIDTEKKLPHNDLNTSYLKKYEYLKIEKIDLETIAKKITPYICQRIGKEIAYNKLFKDEKLLKWIDKLVYHVPDHFGKIPFIVHQNNLFSLDVLINEETAWILNSNTIEYKNLFDLMGYNTINLELDTYTNIKRFLSEVTGYLNDKNLAYERISKNSKISDLDPLTKVKLIEFFRESKFMNGIGEGKYYGEINLFKNEGGIAYPLNELISRKDNLEINTLDRFRICQAEYGFLPEYIKNKLIKKEEIFTRFILNPELFHNWTLDLGYDNTNLYVSSLKEIYSWLPVDTEIPQSQWAAIPWMFFDEKSIFIESTDIYWSEAFYQMNEETYELLAELFYKYELKVLPNKFCGDLIKLFKLKTDSTLIDTWDEIKQIDTITANSILDWMEADGNYGDFFENFNLVSENSIWDIVAVEDYKVYDGDNTQLKTYIESIKDLNLKFKKLDSLLSSDNRIKIGLLQGDKFLKEIIDTKLFDQELAKHLPAKAEWKLIESFIQNLSLFELKTNVEYDSNTAEHILINQILKYVEEPENIPEEIQNIINQFRSKISINDQPISNFDLSDNIQFGKGEDRKEIKLSYVLEEFKGESDVLDKIINSFVAITNKTKLRKIIFKTRKMKYEEIANRIEESNLEYYTVYQIIFQDLLKLQNINFNWKKDDIWGYIADQSELRIKNELIFLDEIYRLKIKDKSYLACEFVEEKWALQKEIAPKWMLDWLKNDYENKYEFLNEVGFNGLNSSIVKLRKAIINNQYIENDVIVLYEEASKNFLISNTLEWIAQFNSDIITKNIKLIKLIYKTRFIYYKNSKQIYIPILNSITRENVRSYDLVSLDVSEEIFVLNNNQDFSFEIYNKLKTEFDKCVIVDDNCDKLLENYFQNKKEIQLQDNTDDQKLCDNSKLWDEPFYKKWEFYNDYPIYIFDGDEIPFVRKFNDITINHFTLDLKIEVYGEFYVSKILKSDILNNLPATFPKDKLGHLINWHYRTLQDPSLLEEPSYFYEETFDRMIQDRYGLPVKEQNDESSNAKREALYYLKSLGYNVKSGNSDVLNYSALYNLIDPNGKNVNCIVRSAKGGLLYVDKEHWDMFESSNTLMFVSYPGNSPRLFKSREELLDEELAKNILFRFKNTKKSADIDTIFRTIKKDSNLILVTSEKMKATLFSKLKNNKTQNKEGDSAIGDDNFEL